MTSSILEPSIESSMVTPEVIAAHNSSRKRVTKRIAFFESDGVTPWEPEKTSRQAMEASISVDGSRDERRTLTLNVLNNKGVFDNRVDGFWYDKIVKAYRGLRYWSPSEYKYKHFEYKLGEFMIDQINTAWNSSVVEISGRDYSKKLMLDQFDEPVTFQDGSNVDELVKTIAWNGGIRRFRLNTGAISVNAPASFEEETSRWEAINKICEPFNVEVFFNNEGELETRIRKDVSDPSAVGLRFSIAGSNAPRNLISASRSSSDSQVFNAVRVYATGEENNVTGARFVCKLENTDPASPTSIQRIGRRPTSYSSELFTSQQEVDEYARKFFEVSTLQDFSLSFDGVVYPWLEANEIVNLEEDSGSRMLERYLVTEFSIPVGIGSMSGTAKRITKVGHVDVS